MPAASVLWRRLDAPGHDGCRLEELNDGWRLDGTAVFLHEGTPARLTYRVACDRAWRTRDGSVGGWVGVQPVDFAVQHTSAGEWTLNGVLVPHLDGCVDLDLGLTPATNLFQLRRVALGVGESADVRVAWLDVPAGTLTVLDQRYERRGESTYWYEAPRFDYAASLEVDAVGFVRSYPGLWEAES
jgi:hypothetical protein